MKKLISFAAASMLAVSAFTACGKDSDSKSSSGGFSGKWAGYDMTVDGQTMTSFNMYIVNIPLDAFIHVEINDDGTLEASSGVVGGTSDDEDAPTKGTWEKVDDDTIKIHPDASTVADSMAGDFLEDGVELDLVDDMLVMKGTDPEEGKDYQVRFKRTSEWATYDVSSILGGLADSFGE
ncbi:MAG: hypothetical protein IKO47_07290 [Ruminococcus sp.]|nr:hypothetical protein [Ruminococcus sp.]